MGTHGWTIAIRDPRWVALGVLCVGMLMVVLDNTVVNVALPSIQSDLGFTHAGLAWVVNAYMIAFGGLLLLAGRLGDLIGSRRVFVTGLVIFTAASALCGLAWRADVLVAARFVQGLGGAMASSVILAMIVTTFEEARERARALGAFSFVASAGGSIGLLLGGAITQALSWHWAFLVNVPIGIAALFLARAYLKGGGGIGLRAGADVLGALSITASLMLAVYTVVASPDQAPGSPQTWILGGVALALFVAFLARQATAATPLLPLRLFRSRNLSGSNLLQALLVAGMFGFFFLDSLYLRRSLGYDAVHTGLAFLPVTVAIGALSLGWSARLAERFGPRTVILAGIALAVAGLGICALAPRGDYLTTIFPAMVLIGAGMGASFPSIMMFAMSDATADDSGVTSGVVNTTSNVGGAFGLAILATIPDAHVAFGAAAVVMALAGVVAATVLQPERLDANAEASSPAAA
jgi:EmrB/QacA subfamily drug resistance transporter